MRSRRVLLATVALASMFPLGTSEATPVLITTGSVLLPGSYGAELSAYRQLGCGEGRPDGIMGAVVNVEAYQGQTLEVWVTQADVILGEAFLYVDGFRECDVVAPAIRHGFAAPLAVYPVTTERYLALSFFDEVVTNVQFSVYRR